MEDSRPSKRRKLSTSSAATTPYVDESGGDELLTTKERRFIRSQASKTVLVQYKSCSNRDPSQSSRPRSLAHVTSLSHSSPDVSGPPKDLVQNNVAFGDVGSGFSSSVRGPHNDQKSSELPHPDSDKSSGWSHLLPSPVQLTTVNGLPASVNVDTVNLHDILSNPLVKECWAFNYLFDVDWMLAHFDSDVRDQIQVRLVHGFWKREDPRRLYLEEATKKWANAQAISAYLPEPFGTHHSKMFILINHDDTAQVVILTANVLEQDWRMAQAVWRSPLLPLLPSHYMENSNEIGSYGDGSRFKHDLISYLKAYGPRLRALTDKLSKYNFSAIRAALIASAPGRQNIRSQSDLKATLFGWPGLRRILQHVPASPERSRVVAQVSSVGMLGVNDSWLRRVFFATLAYAKNQDCASCDHSIIFPTATEIRQTHEGYACGGSIHFKTQKPANKKQLTYMRPMLCHWSGLDRFAGNEGNAPHIKEAGRGRAGPHIKTYIRFSNHRMDAIDWAMVTSANLSKQAWGEAESDSGTVRVCSYELGVVIWPGLYARKGESARMMPAFQRDDPDGDTKAEVSGTLIGFRMPYNLPLLPYMQDEEPWCCTASHHELDCKGKTWRGY